MRRTASWMTALLMLLVAAVAVSADRVRLRSGKVIEGMFIGADSKTVRILLDDGRVSRGADRPDAWPSSSRRASPRPRLRRRPQRLRPQRGARPPAAPRVVGSRRARRSTSA